jgi:hypothetical protein
MNENPQVGQLARDYFLNLPKEAQKAFFFEQPLGNADQLPEAAERASLELQTAISNAIGEDIWPF